MSLCGNGFFVRTRAHAFHWTKSRKNSSRLLLGLRKEIKKRTNINYNFRRRPTKSAMCVKYNPRYDPDAWYFKPSPDECKPAWTFPANRPLITHSSTVTVLKVSNLHELGSDLKYIIPGHSYMQQGVRVHIFLNELNCFVKAS